MRGSRRWRSALPAVLEGHGPVPYRVAGFGCVFGIEGEVAQPGKLIRCSAFCRSQGRLKFAALTNFKAVGIQEFREVPPIVSVGRWVGEKPVIEAYFGVDGRGRIDLMQGALGFDSARV